MPGAVPESSDTPLMRQYLEVKAQYPDCIVFFRLGDFYEMFFDDALLVARTLDLTLTTRDKNKADPVPMCGVPHHAARQYLGRLVERGFSIAICEQVEDPRAARGIVRREVVRVVTPGVVLDEEQLDPKAASYLVAARVVGERAGLACLDVTTGEFAATELAARELVDELARLAPREVLLEGSDAAPLRLRVQAAYAEWPKDAPESAVAARELIETTLGCPLDPARFSPLALTAAGAALAYARRTQPIGTLPVTRLEAYQPSDHLILDEATRANLELYRTLNSVGGTPQKEGSLLGVLDETCTSMGGRLLRAWVGAPLLDVGQIRRRQDAIGWLVEHAALRAEVRAELAAIYDLERLAGRATLGVATPRDLAALCRSLTRLPALRERLRAAIDSPAGLIDHPELLELGEDLCAEVAAEIASLLVDDPPAQWKEGGFCRRGFKDELDALLDLAEGGKGKIAEIETRERARTGIASLKVRYNRVFGYYLEITRSNLDRVPGDYVRKQTLANAERFVTPELNEYEAKILGAEERRLALELEAFERLRSRVAAAAPRILHLGEVVARIDALCGLAEVAHASGYVRPEVDSGGRIEIEDGRHPVVERLAARGRFVPNDVTLDPASAQLCIITGPNMAGKSTVMRQVALITLMAQTGSFVPARRARVGMVDRIFTRVGASDNVGRGESTFMVEMRETAHIVDHATRRSLVILDEIGRGTSTYDGLAIAWAVAEHLHDRIGCKTMFATHYHELTALADSRPRVRNLSTAVREWKDEVVFLHKLVQGGASRSYGIEVARLAGLEPEVVRRARALLAALEQGREVGHHAVPTAASGGAQLSLLGPTEPPPGFTAKRERSRTERALAEADLDGMSPREAHAFLAELKARLGAES